MTNNQKAVCRTCLIPFVLVHDQEGRCEVVWEDGDVAIRCPSFTHHLLSGDQMILQVVVLELVEA